MTPRGRAIARALYRDDSGQILPLVAGMLIVLLGMAGLAVDVGHVYTCHRELQASADASALAGATAMAGASSHPLATTVSGVQAIATNYSSLPGKKNAYSNLPNVTMLSGYPQLKCLSTLQAQGISCVGFVPYNAVQVKLQADVPLTFARIFGFPTMTIAASATAAKGGGPSRPYNIAILMDSTGSMRSPDWNCDPSGNTSKLVCELQSIQVLLQYLDPCGIAQPTCTITAGNAANSVARVSLFTFPEMSYPTVGNDTNCGTTPPTSTVYSYPATNAASYDPGTSSTSMTFRVLGFQSDYRTSDLSTALNTSSLVVNAVGGTPGCNGIMAPNNITYNNTYYPAPMYAAQAALTAEQNANPGSENVMIIVGDGDNNTPQKSGSTVVMPSPATASGNYPSWLGECSQAVTAAHAFTNTTVYTVAYGAPASGCSTDQDAAFSPNPNTSAYPNIQPCGEMSRMATYSWDFFSDYLQSGSSGNCIAPQTFVALSDIFRQIAGDLTEARLVADGTT
jgi:hypothetical protein